jgi:hypothetical protein|tara:strand:+ start:31622 stop:32137 length:516 start_codon:yes stop_codon:yes gene_type:complete
MNDMTTDTIQKWVGNARNAEYGFFNACLYALEQFQEKNNKPLYALIAFTNGKKFGSYQIEQGYKLTQFNAPLKRVLNHALSDVKFTFTKDGKAKVKVGENGGANADVIRAMRELSDLHKGKIGVKSEHFKEMFPAPTPQAKEFDVKAWAERAAKAHPEQVEAMIAALQAQR